MKQLEHHGLFFLASQKLLGYMFYNGVTPSPVPANSEKMLSTTKWKLTEWSISHNRSPFINAELVFEWACYTVWLYIWKGALHLNKVQSVQKVSRHPENRNLFWFKAWQAILIWKVTCTAMFTMAFKCSFQVSNWQSWILQVLPSSQMSPIEI